MIKLGSWEFPPNNTKGKDPKSRGNIEVTAAALAAALAAASPEAAAQTGAPIEGPRIESSDADTAETRPIAETGVNRVELYRKLREDFTSMYRAGDVTSIPASIFDTRVFGPVTTRDMSIDDPENPGTQVHYRHFRFQYTQAQGNILEIRLSSLGEVTVLSPVQFETQRLFTPTDPTPVQRFEQAAILVSRMLVVPAGPDGRDRMMNQLGT